MNASNLKELLCYAIEQNEPVLITGIPGIGKTDITHQASTEKDADLIVSHPVVNDPTDYKGLPFAEKNGETAKFLPFGELNQLIHATKKTVFFLDDLGQAPPSVQAACMQLLLARRINGHKVSDNVVFIAATNRKEDRAGVSGILEPVKSRFSTIVELEVSVDDWVQWAIRNNMPIELISFVRFKPEYILCEKFKPTKEMKNSPTPRTLSAVGRNQNKGLSKSFEKEFFKGAAGESFAVEYSAYLEMFRELPHVDEIIMNPKTAKVSTEPGVLCAISGALAAKMTEQTIDPIVTYLDRLPLEIATVAMQDGLTRNRNILFTKGYSSWSAKHGNILMGK